MLPNVSTTPQNIAELVKSVAIHVGSKGQFARFKKLYSHDRIAFVYDCLPTFAKSMADYQEEILGYFDDGKNRVSVRGPHGLGKTALASILTQHSVLTAETDCKVPTTASAWRQLEKYLWPEIKKTARFLDWLEIGRDPYTRDELLQMSIKLNGGIVEAFAVASDDYTTIEGAHATRIVYIFDESKTIPRATWNAAEGAFSTEGLEATEYEKGIIPLKSNRKSLVGSPAQSEEAYNSNSPIDNHSIGNHSSNNSIAIEESIVIPSSVSYQESIKEDFVPIHKHIGSPSELKSSKQGNSTPPLRPSVSSTKGFEDHRNKDIKSTSDSIYEAIAFAISTPGDPSGQFYDIHMRRPGYEDWTTRHVTVEEAIRAGRISNQWVNQRKLQWGEDSSVYQNRVLGEFADNTEEGVIPLSWIRASIDRWYEWERQGFEDRGESGVNVLGVDVARYGEDKTVIAWRHGWGVQKVYAYSKLSSTNNAGHVKALCAGKKVHIEMDGGLGASVYDILKEQEVKGLVPITVSGGTTFKDRSGELGFVNVRAAMWWNMRQLLDPAYNSVLKLPPIEELILDLSTPKWEMMKNATIKLESKDSIASRIGRSTDYGDSVCLAFWSASRGGGIVF